MTTHFSHRAAARGKKPIPVSPQTGVFPAAHTLFFIGGKYRPSGSFLSAVKTLSTASFVARIGNA